MSAIAIFILDDGMRTSSLYAVVALRSRASMSAIGSVIVMGSPARLRDARELAGVGKLSQADAAEAELTVVGPGPSAPLASVVLARRELRGPLLLLDETFLRHAYSVLKGKPSALSSARASSSFRAVVTTVMCMPRTLPTWS